MLDKQGTYVQSVVIGQALVNHAVTAAASLAASLALNCQSCWIFQLNAGQPKSRFSSKSAVQLLPELCPYPLEAG